MPDEEEPDEDEWDDEEVVESPFKRSLNQLPVVVELEPEDEDDPDEDNPDEDKPDEDE